MKKMNLKRVQKARSFTFTFVVMALAFLSSCETQEEAFAEINVNENAITDSYAMLDVSIVNTGEGIPQGLETIGTVFGDTLELTSDGFFESATTVGHWTIDGSTFTFLTSEGHSVRFEIEKMDDQCLSLLQRFDSSNGYSSGIVSYTFVKNNIDLDVLSSFEILF